jgi:hypothetical protein
MFASTFGFLKWTYQIQPPCGKRPGDRYGLEMMRWHIFLASKELAPFTTMDQGIGVVIEPPQNIGVHSLKIDQVILDEVRMQQTHI